MAISSTKDSVGKTSFTYRGKDMIHTRKISCVLILGIITLYVLAAPIAVQAGTIQQMIDEARDGDTVVIPAGEHYERLVIRNRNNLTIQGADPTTPSSTIINGMREDDVIRIEKSSGILIDGLTLRESSTAMLVSDSTATVRNLVINDNGCGLESFGATTTHVTVSSVTITRNRIGIASRSNMDISESIITDNLQGGIVARVLGSDYCRWAIERTTISNNLEYGIEARKVDLTVDHCSIANNDHYGILVVDSKLTRIVESEIVGNREGASFVRSSVTVTNTTIADNQDLGGVRISDGSVSMSNCVISGNSTSGYHPAAGVTVEGKETVLMIEGNRFESNTGSRCGGLYSPIYRIRKLDGSMLLDPSTLNVFINNEPCDFYIED